MKDTNPAELFSIRAGLANFASGGDEGIRTLGPHLIGSDKDRRCQSNVG